MDKFVYFVQYLFKVFETHNALTYPLLKLPQPIQEHAIAIGEWIKQFMGWG